MNPARSPVAFGRFIITRRIARGGMAEIYRARTRSTPTTPAMWVAIKMMRATLGHEELRHRLFEREVRIATRLHHPNVVPVYEFGRELDRPYLAMEYVRGRDLAHLLKPASENENQAPIEFELGLYIGFLAAQGLGHAHRLRDEETGEPLEIVHRDMSPGNVIVGYDGTVKVLDFGVARINETQGYQTQTGTLRGKFAYMSPEQTLGEDLDARSDVFSFGTVLYELLTGANCFRASNPIATLERVQGMRPVPPSRALRMVPKDVDKILAQCLSKDKRRRFPDGIAVSEAIGDYLSRRNYDGHARLVEHMATTFSWEQHEEASELAREQEEVALMEVVDFVPDLTNDGLDSKRIAVSTQEEASQSEVRQMTVHEAGGSVFAEDVPSSSLSPANPLAEDLPLGRGQSVQASSLLAPAAVPEMESIDGAAPPVAYDASDDQPTAHAAVATTGVTAGQEGPLPSPKAAPWYRGPATVAALATASILVVAWILAAPAPIAPIEGEAKPDDETPTLVAPVTIRLPENARAAKARKARRRRRSEPSETSPTAPKSPSQSAALEPNESEASPRSKQPSETRRTKSTKARSTAKSRAKARRRRASRSKKGRTGFLNVGAKPWAQITIDGKRWPYQTPQAGIELPVGKHVVVLHNPNTGVTKRTAVFIKHGQYRTVNLDLRRR